MAELTAGGSSRRTHYPSLGERERGQEEHSRPQDRMKGNRGSLRRNRDVNLPRAVGKCSTLHRTMKGIAALIIQTIQKNAVKRALPTNEATCRVCRPSRSMGCAQPSVLGHRPDRFGGRGGKGHACCTQLGSRGKRFRLFTIRKSPRVRQRVKQVSVKKSTRLGMQVFAMTYAIHADRLTLKSRNTQFTLSSVSKKN